MTVRFDLANATLSDAIAAPLVPLGRSIQDLAASVIDHAHTSGWKAYANSTGLALTRAFDVHVVDPDWFPGVTDRHVTLSLPPEFVLPAASRDQLLNPLVRTAARQRDGEVHVAFGTRPESAFTLVAPAHTVLTTAPSSVAAATTGGREERAIALTDGRTDLDYEVVSHAFRIEPLTFLATATLWSPFKWLLTVLILIVNDDVRDWLRTSLRPHKRETEPRKPQAGERRGQSPPSAPPQE